MHSIKLYRLLINFLNNFKKGIFRLTSRQKPFLFKFKPTIIKRSEHPLSRRNISPHALKVLYRLHQAGYSAYLVGGGVRDVLLGLTPKDFDIATNAKPEEVANLFRNSRLIGRRFRLVHVFFGSHIVEVATFRAAPKKEHEDFHLARSREDGLILRDNIYGTLEEDIFRRDFTINALYYNIADFTLIDCLGAVKDLKLKRIRIIGEPLQRYREDPVRMLRAIRFAAKLNFKIHPETEKPILKHQKLICNVPQARLLDEYLKLFLGGFSKESFRLLRHYGFIQLLFPALEHLLRQEELRQEEHKNHNNIERFLKLALENTDERISTEKSVSVYFLLAVFLWYPVFVETQQWVLKEELSINAAFHAAFFEVWQEQKKYFAIPKGMLQNIKEMFSLQFRFQKKNPKTIALVFHHPRFKAAYDLLLLRTESKDPEVLALAAWWTEYIKANEEVRKRMVSELSSQPRKKRKRFHSH